ncbi:hypothetical protein BDF20DRAFT_842406 [Mycotypha africana]|uniref:uncharacterized protein n=1 Tax=Mycotypha africana TaxID=64632 RepID=UPI002300B90B|nr:uncharacterized protein BDF20DRAFT_842406 [Mycotypha africana]KAI8991055.1 hypothetical protein BDF20DRAFT_842406 [Mycotypha africana]
MFTILGLISSFIGMGGLVLAIVSLFPLNGYNIFLTSSTIIKLILFEYDRLSTLSIITTTTAVNLQQPPQYIFINISKEVLFYLLFLTASSMASVLHNITTFVAFCQCQWLTLRSKETEEVLAEEEAAAAATAVSAEEVGAACVAEREEESARRKAVVGDDIEGQEDSQERKKYINNSHVHKDMTSIADHRHRRRRKPWFVRLFCLTLMTELFVALLGTQLTMNKAKEIDASVIPLTIQTDTLFSCGILWITSLSIVFFSFIILFASFCILIGSYQQCNKTPKKTRRGMRSSVTTHPLQQPSASPTISHDEDDDNNEEENERRPLLLN